MSSSSSPFRPSTPEVDSSIILTDDGGSGLYDACMIRFAAPGYEVACDERHTVWVKCVDGSRSIGLSPWILRQRSMSEVLDHAERKLSAPFAKL